MEPGFFVFAIFSTIPIQSKVQSKVQSRSQSNPNPEPFSIGAKGVRHNKIVAHSAELNGVRIRVSIWVVVLNCN